MGKAHWPWMAAAMGRAHMPADASLPMVCLQGIFWGPALVFASSSGLILLTCKDHPRWDKAPK